jgi:hypothetical protein
MEAAACSIQCTSMYLGSTSYIIILLSIVVVSANVLLVGYGYCFSLFECAMHGLYRGLPTSQHNVLTKHRLHPGHDAKAAWGSAPTPELADV